LVHRFNTWIHLIARAPYRCGDSYNVSWSFRDSDLEATLSAEFTRDSTDVDAMREKEIITDEMKRRYRQNVRKPIGGNNKKDKKSGISFIKTSSNIMATVRE